MDHVKSLKCLICGTEYAPDEIDYVCPITAMKASSMCSTTTI